MLQFTRDYISNCLAKRCRFSLILYHLHVPCSYRNGWNLLFLVMQRKSYSYTHFKCFTLKYNVYLHSYLIVYYLTNFEVYSLQIYFVDGQKGDYLSTSERDAGNNIPAVLLIPTIKHWRTFVGRGSKNLIMFIWSSRASAWYKGVKRNGEEINIYYSSNSLILSKPTESHQSLSLCFIEIK